MTEPIAELIAQDIEARLKEVKLSNAATADLFVIRPTPNQKLTPLANKNACYMSMESMGARTDAAQTTGRELPFSILTYVTSDESLQTPIDTILMRAAADIEKALTYDESSRKRGGYAFTTTWKQTTLMYLTHAPCVLVIVSVQFATQTRDPFSSAYT